MIRPSDPRLSNQPTLNLRTVAAIILELESTVLEARGNYPAHAGPWRMLVSAADKAEVIRQSAEAGWHVTELNGKFSIEPTK